MTLGALFPGSLWDTCLVATIALALDLWLGDPPLPWPHPVCLIGRCLNFLEPRWRHFASASPPTCRLRLLVSGFLTLLLLASATFVLVLALAHLPWVGWAFTLYFAWAGLAMGCLLRTSALVLDAVEENPLPDARAKVSWLVSRQTSAMDRDTLRKTLADTLGENYTDAFLAPFFWLLVAGVPGLWVYKVVSTMDSQWGYMTPQWRYLGYAGAKADDAFAFIPARLSPLALGLAHMLLRVRGHATWHGHWPGYGAIARAARIMPSPNSGWPMATCAWLCSGRMAGPAIYFGKLQDKPFMGPLDARPWNRQKLAALRQLLFWGAITGGLMLLTLAYAISLLA